MGPIEAAARITAVMHWRSDGGPGEGYRGKIPAKVADDARSALGFNSFTNENVSGYTVRAVEGFDPAGLAGPVGCLPTALIYRLALGRFVEEMAKAAPDVIQEILTKSWMFAGDEMARPSPGTRPDFVGGRLLADLIAAGKRRQEPS